MVQCSASSGSYIATFSNNYYHNAAAAAAKDVSNALAGGRSKVGPYKPCIRYDSVRFPYAARSL